MPALPVSLVLLLSLLRPAFTAPSFQTFEALVAGFLGRVGEHTVTGMWQAARLAGRVHHSRAHDFFARARWSADELGLLLCDFVVSVLVDSAAPLRLAVDGTFFGRCGRNVHGARWQHDPHAQGKGALRFGNSFVVVGLLARIPRLGERSWCLPLLFRLWLPTPKPTKSDPQPERRPSQPELAARADRAGLRPLSGPADRRGRRCGVCMKALAALPEQLTLTARLRSNAAI